jgi:hypothetical protein
VVYFHLSSNQETVADHFEQPPIVARRRGNVFGLVVGCGGRSEALGRTPDELLELEKKSCRLFC